MPVVDLLSSPALLAAIFAIVVAASIVQAGLGMGFGLASAPLLALIDPRLVPGPVLIIAVVTSIWAAWREHAAIKWNELQVGIAGRVIGVFAGSVLLASLVNQQMFMLTFGGLIASAVLLSVSGWRLPFNSFTLLIMAALSGLMGTITSVGAPPMALIYQIRPASEARPTLASFFAIGSTLSLLGLYLSGWGRSSDVVLAVLMVPPMLLGTFIARRLSSTCDPRFRPILLCISAAAAAGLICRAIP